MSCIVTLGTCLMAGYREQWEPPPTGCPNPAGFCRTDLPQSTMKVAFLSLLALVSAALAVPPHDPQSVFGVSKQDIQGIREGSNSVFDNAEDKVKQWVQDGRDFINHNGLTCESRSHNGGLRDFNDWI